MTKVAFDSESNISLYDEFIADIASDKGLNLELFWVSYSKNIIPEVSEMIEYGSPVPPEIDKSTLPYHVAHKIKVDRFEEDKYLIDFSVSGIEGISQLEFKLDNYKYWRFYYKDMSTNKFKIAFDILIDTLSSYVGSVSALNYARNILLLDLTIYHPVFNFHQAYKYSNDVAVPLYQHYHLTNLVYSDNENVMDGGLVKKKLIEYLTKKKSYISYGNKSSSDSYLEVNRVHISDKLDKPIIVNDSDPSILTYRVNNRSPIADNSNLFNAFDNTEQYLLNTSYDKYPLITLYGTNYLVHQDELDPEWELLIYELEE